MLNGVDELIDKSQLSDETWATLGERLNDQQRIGDYVSLIVGILRFSTDHGSVWISV